MMVSSMIHMEVDVHLFKAQEQSQMKKVGNPTSKLVSLKSFLFMFN